MADLFSGLEKTAAKLQRALGLTLTGGEPNAAERGPAAALGVGLDRPIVFSSTKLTNGQVLSAVTQVLPVRSKDEMMPEDASPRFQKYVEGKIGDPNGLVRLETSFSFTSADGQPLRYTHNHVMEIPEGFLNESGQLTPDAEARIERLQKAAGIKVQQVLGDFSTGQLTTNLSLDVDMSRHILAAGLGTMYDNSFNKSVGSYYGENTPSIVHRFPGKDPLPALQP